MTISDHSSDVTSGAARESACATAGGGRPRIFDTPDDMADAILRYVDECDVTGAPITLTAMMLSAGCASLQTLYDYEKRPGFKEITQVARALVAVAYEEKLDRDKCVGAIFALKKVAGWTNRRTVTSSSVVNRIDWSKVTDDQLRRMRNGESAISVLGSGIKDLLLPEEEVDMEIVQTQVSSNGTDHG